MIMTSKAMIEKKRIPPAAAIFLARGCSLGMATVL